jgi:large subunit ribosomal protein L24
MKKIRKGDLVILITGRDKGRKGAVIEVLADDRVRVEGLNMSKKHQKPTPHRARSAAARVECADF